MLLCRKSEDTSPQKSRGQDGRTFEGGPVFVPSRRLSALGRRLIAATAEQDRLTAYDQNWYADPSRS